MTPHPHAAVLHAIALGGEAEYNPGDAWRVSSQHINPISCPQYEWRVKPRTITRTVTYPAPETVAPARGATYYTPNAYQGYTNAYHWRDTLTDGSLLHRGLVYLRLEDAEARARAMLGEE